MTGIRPRQSIKEHPLVHLFGTEHYSSSGQKVFSSPGGTLEDGETTQVAIDATTWGAMVRDHNIAIGLIVSALIAPALEAVNLQHPFSLAELYDVCRPNPHIPQGHQAAWAQGLLNGLNGDFFSAICVLVPQIEHFVRIHLKANGVHTLVADDRGAEPRKGWAFSSTNPVLP